MEDQLIPFELAVKLEDLGFKEKCMDYLIRFHEKAVRLVRSKIK